ncbi:MAG TPA: ribosome small subunit-dependent GTPase A [Myxococcaceae bacterium]|nr:ribosome small subunit-dependent GTPase A [Myxococcaceae bacterium]
MTARPSGRMRLEAEDAGDLPVVGDVVVLSGISVQSVLPRKNALVRRDPGADKPQLIAANVDLALIVEPLDRPVRRSRLERMMAVARSGGVAPVIVLSKMDLHEDPFSEAEAVREALGAEAKVLVLSAVSGDGMDALRALLAPGVVAALLGPSGAGKSTLINALLGEDRLEVGEVRDWDHKGRHTTTRRELVELPSGAKVIDGPGMREFGLWAAGGDELDATFGDVAELAGECRFRDCAHQGEPGCAVREAVVTGDLSSDRLDHYHRLQREQTRGSPERRRLERILGKASRDASRDKRRH